MSMRYLGRAIATLPGRLLLVLVYLFTIQWVSDLIAVCRRRLQVRRRGEELRDVRRGRPLHCSPRCAVVRPDVYKRPDPLIYSQSYLMEQGLAVTWDNPDIQLYEGGIPVPSSALKADTQYDIVATIYNNSTSAPAVGLHVEFSYLSFGIGTVRTPIGTAVVDLPVKGSPQHPAHAKAIWRTPQAAGHYCLQVKLIWPDDANPRNNLGQENTNVAVAASPAVFKFPVRNDDTVGKRIRMTADAYAIPSRMNCREVPRKKDSERRHRAQRRTDVFIPPSEAEADWVLARVRHGLPFPIPEGWSVHIEPAGFELASGATQAVTVAITPPDTWRGERAFNINAMHGPILLGGVTLIAKR